MKKFLRWILIIIAIPILLFVGALAVVSLLGITVNLDKARPMVEKAASAALERKVEITGSVELLPTLSSRLEVHDVRIDNPEGWGSPDFVAVKLVRIQLELIDLLRKKISMDEITAEGVSIYLESRKNGINNWSFSSPDERKTTSEDVSSPEEKSSGGIAFKAVDKVSLKTIEVTYKDVVLGKTVSFQLDELTGEAPAGKSLVFHARGSLQEKSYSFDLDAGALDTFRPKQQAWPLDLTGDIAGTPFSAKGDFGNKNNEQQLSLDMSMGAVDVGKLLSWLNVADNIKASTEELTLTLQLKGDSLHELLKQSEFNFHLKGGILDLGNPDSGSDFLISKLDGKIGAKHGSAIGVSLNGIVDTTPVSITIKGMPLVKYIDDSGELPVTIVFAAAGAELDFSGAVGLPVDSKTFNLAMSLKGENLDTLDEFLNIDLPPFGPYSLDAKFAATDSGYDLSNLAIKVGSSDLSGSMSLNHKGDRPEVTLQLTSKVLQLDDFALGDWSLDGKKDSVEDEKEAKEQLPEKQVVEEKSSQPAVIPSFLSPESLSRFNGSLSIEMEQVLSGKDTLGKGSLKSTLQDGRFAIAPLQLDLANGTAKLEFSFQPTAKETAIHLDTKIEKLDVGILARRVKPETTMGGVLNLDVELDSTAPELSGLMAYAKGRFDFAFIPVDFDASLIDLWAVNLLSALASEVDGQPKSIINCLVASFAMEDGMMHERTIFMDTTHMSIEGEANINFKTEELKLKMAPKAKRPEFFSLATPVKVQGTFEDFGIGINKISLTTTVVSFISSPVHVPLRRIFSGERPDDGVEACRAAWENRNPEE
ncbi:MAG: AsmA family protein [Thermodesulfobacteriota bacterium]|nr:AsmA family protein [Thermodesulfobacteriota bacterium]